MVQNILTAIRYICWKTICISLKINRDSLIINNPNPTVLYPAYRHAAVLLYHAMDFMRRILYTTCLYVVILRQPNLSVPSWWHILYVLLALMGVSSSQQEGVKVDTGGCCCPHGRVLARPYPGLSHINTRVLRRKKGGVATSMVYH